MLIKRGAWNSVRRHFRVPVYTRFGCVTLSKQFIMNAMYVVSFGNSKQYVVRLVSNSPVIDDLRQELKGYLERTFPRMQGLDYYAKMKVKYVPKEMEPEYAGYPVFTDGSIDEIKDILDTEAEDEASLRCLNSNDAFGS